MNLFMILITLMNKLMLLISLIYNKCMMLLTLQKEIYDTGIITFTDLIVTLIALGEELFTILIAL